MVHSVLPTLPRYRFVIVDESRTLRDEENRTYDSVQKYLHDNEATYFCSPQLLIT